jgi:hypothetical protein
MKQRTFEESKAWIEKLRLKCERSPNRDRMNLYRSQLHKLRIREEKQATSYWKAVAANTFYQCALWKSIRSKVLANLGTSCLKCGSSLAIAVDHILPRSLYPELALREENLQVLCRSCNSSKGNRSTEDFRARKN